MMSVRFRTPRESPSIPRDDDSDDALQHALKLNPAAIIVSEPLQRREPKSGHQGVPSTDAAYLSFSFRV